MTNTNRRRFPILLATTLALLAILGALFLPDRAQAQAIVLVSNIGQSDDSSAFVNPRFLRAQAFSVPTGGGDYTLTSIDLLFTSEGISASNISSLTVGVWSADSSGHPETSQWTLTNPAEVTLDTEASFGAPAGATLEAGKTYLVVVDNNNTSLGNFQGPTWVGTASDAQDATSTTDWTIGDVGLWKLRADASWSDDSDANAQFLRVNGSAASGEDDPPPLSTDATLSGLSLGTGVTLSPAFASGTDTYTASVANSVDEVTVTPTTNHASATVEILDTDDNELNDSDDMEDDFQVALSVGDTVIKVKVTAEDGTSSQTYTVTVTRAADMTPDDPPDDSGNVSEGDTDLPGDTTTTGKVEVGGSVTGTIADTTDDLTTGDSFKVDLEAGKRYQIDVEGAPTGRGTLPDPWLGNILDPDGNLVQNSGDNDDGVGLNARLILTPTADGTHYVNVQSYFVPNNQQGTYTLSVILLGANGASEADTDFPATTATTGRVDVGASVTGNIGTNTDEDWFRVDLEAGKTYQFDLEGAHNGRGTLPDPYLFVYDGLGTGQAQNNDVDNSLGNLNSRGVFAPTATGTYYLEASEANSANTGTYTLSVRDITPLCTLNTGDIWCGVVTVERIPLLVFGEVSDGYVAAFPAFMTPQFGDLSNKNFTYDGTRYTIDTIAVSPPVLTSYGGVYFSLDRALPRNVREALVLYIGPTSRNSSPSGVTSLSGFNASVDYEETSHTFYWRPDGQTDVGESDLGPGVDWSSQAAVTVRLRENAPPVFTSAAAFTVNENETTVGEVTATDADPGDTYLRYEITGGTDRYESDGTTERFEIDDTSGELSFKSAPNYEDPQDAGADNTYEVVVEARSGMDLKKNSERGITNRTPQPITVTVTDADEQSAKPAKPTLAKVAGSSTSLTATWTKPDLDGGPDITGYNVAYREYATGTGGEWTALDNNVTAVTAIITGLSADTAYQARVQAENGELPSDWSDPSDPFSPKSCALNTGDLWCGVVTVAGVLGNTAHGFVFDDGDLDGNPEDKMFLGYPIGGVAVGTTGNAAGALGVILDEALSDDHWATLELHVDGHSKPFAFSAASTQSGDSTYTWADAGLDWSSASTVTLRLRRTDPPMLGVASASATEGKGVAFTVTLSPATGRQVTATWTASIESGDTASAADLGTTKTGTVEIEAGETEATFEVATAQDAADEDDETFTVTLSNQSPSVVGLADATATGTIRDDDDLRVVTIAGPAGGATLEELDAEFTLSRTGSTAAALTVSVAVTQQADRDLLPDGAAANRTVTFAVAAATAVLTVELEDDDLRELRGDLTVEVQAGTGYTVGNPSRAVVDVRDGDQGAPLTPQGLTAAAGAAAGEVVLTWTEPAPHLAYDLHQYRYKTDGAYGSWTNIPDSGRDDARQGANLADYTVTGLAGGQEHTFQVRAQISYGTLSVNVFSAASNEAKATPPVPAVTLHLTDSSANAVGNATVLENRGTITVTATVAPGSVTPFTVTVSASPVAPATTDDFTLSDDRVLSFAANATESTGMVTIGVVDDDVPEPSDVVTVSGAVSDTAVTAPEDVTLTIANDDVDVPFDITVEAPATVAEDAGTAPVRVTLTTQENEAPTIGTDVFFYREGTAEDGADYTSPVMGALVTTLAVSAFSQNDDRTAWEAQTMFTIGIVDDGLDEADETIEFRIATQNEVAPDQTITITDDDAPPSVSFGAASYAVDEGGSVEVAVVLSAPSGRERVEVPLAHEGEGGAALPDDYSGVPAEVTFAAGETERKFTIEAPADAYAEAGEGVALSFGTLPDGATAGSVREATVSLNDVAVTVSFEQAAYTAAEGGSNVVVALTLTPALSHLISIPMTARHGAGATAADYGGIADGRAALFTAGQTRSVFDVTAVDDALDEADETVTFGFTFATSYTGLTKGSVAEATLTLADDDDPPGVEDVMAASAVEGEPVQFEVTLTEASGRTVNLRWQVRVRVDGVSAAAADFDPFPQDGVLTFAPGDTTRTITVATAEDTADEEDETFEVRITEVRITPDGNVDLAGSLTVTGTIEDDDPEPGLSVEDASAVEGEPVQFEVTLTEASGKRVTVDWRASVEPGDTAGAGDFTAANGTLIFTAGQQSKTVEVATARDDIEEEDESFTLTLSNPTNATLSTDRTATGTIDGDPLVLSVASGSAVEGNEVRFTATLSVASTQDVTVDWEVWLDDRSDTAEPEDFADLTAEHGTLTIAAGQTTGTVRVGTAADTLPFETSESFTLLLSNPVNATVADPTVRGTIVNRPPPAARTAFTALPSSNTEVVLAWEAATRESVVQAGVPSNTYVPLFIEMSLNAEITRHEYRYKTVGGAYPATWTAIADSASGGANAYGYTVAGLSNETVYKFQLRTVGVGGNGRPVTSNAVTPTPGICDRTPQVRDAIVAEVPGVADCAHVKLAHLAAIRRLDDHGVGTIEKGIESLRVNDFAGLTNLDTLNLVANELTKLPTGVFAGLTNLVVLYLSDNRLTEVHAGEFAGLTKLTYFGVSDNQLTEIPGDLFAGQPYLDAIRIRNNRLSTLPDGLFAGRASPGLLFVDGNTVDPLPLTVTLEPVGLDQVRAKVPAGAPFEMRLPVTVTDGALADGLTTLTVAAGSVESTPVTVYRTAGTGGAVTVDLGTPLPSPPELHWGYVLTPAASGLPVTVPAAQIAPAAPVEENTTAVRTLRASDAGGGTVTWSKTGGADAARFALTAAGVLTFVSAPDYEAPADVASADPRNDAANNEYVVFVTPSDGTELRLVVRVTNVNEAPTAGTVTIDDMTPAVGVTLTATVAGLVDPDGLPEPFTTLSWQWYRTPTDGSETVIPGAIGATYTAAAADLGATLTAKATYTDRGGFDNTLASDSTAAVLPNTAPVITTTSPVAVAENGTAVATLAATDADRNPIAWSKTGGADADRFALSAQGVLTFKAEPDYESPADVASIDPANDADNNEYVVFVTASDGTDDTELQLVVRVTNANEAPTGTVTIDDTSPTIGDVLTASAAAVADQDGLPDPFTPAWQWYRTPMGGSETEIDGATAATYTVVRADYGATLTAKATWTDKGGFTNTLASAATEATPRPFCTENPGDIWCGVVTVERIPLLVFGEVSDGYVAAFPAFMTPQFGDLSNKNFTYDGTRYTIDTIAVSPPVLTSYGGVYFSLDRALPRNVREALVLYIGPTSRNSSPSGVTSLSGFNASVDYEETSHTFYWRPDGQTDVGESDLGPGVDWSSQAAVTVRLRENAPPVFTSAAAFTVNENETTVGEVTATDADPGDTYLRYEITGGTDRYESDGTTERFEIDDTSGELSFKSAPNYEDPQDAGADNTYEVVVEARSGMDLKKNSERGITNRTPQPITVTVTDADEQSAKPAKPTLAKVTGSSTSLTATWTKPDLDGGPDITGYAVQYKVNTATTWEDFAHTGTAVTTTITGLTADTSYQVQVRAKNGETDSDWSDPSDAVSTNAATPGTTPTLSIADAAASEGSNVTFTVTLSEAAAAAVTATWTASIETDDTAVAADLGTTKTGTVTVAAGNMMGTFEVPVVNDATDEGDETFTVTLSSPSSNAKLETDPTATGTIEDDDATLPTISAVAVTSTPVLETDTYGAGETIEVSVTFDEAVTATSDTDFVLSVAGASRAPLVRGSGTATLVFGYTVVSSDEDDDGIWIGDQDRTLVGNRNGDPQNGTITSVATSTAADLTHAELGQQSDHKVDGSRSIVSVAVSSTPMLETDTYGAGETIRFTVTFNVPVDVSGDPVLAFALGNQGDVRDVDAAHESGSGTTALVFAYTVVSTDEDSNGIFLRDEDDFDDPDGPVRLDSDDTIQFTGTSTDVPLYWQGRGTQSGHKVEGSRTTGNNAPVFTSSASLSVEENTDFATVVAVDNDADDDITGYAITGGTDQLFFSEVTSAGVLSFNDAPNFEDPKDSGTDNTYVVTVQATSGTGTREMTASQTITVTVTDALEKSAKPDKPTLAKVTGSSTSLTATWTKPDLNGGPDITGYAVQYKVNTATTWEDFAHSDTAVTTTITGLTADTSYQVQVRAKNGETDSDWSDPSDAVRTSAVDMPIPPGLEVTLHLSADEPLENAGWIPVTATVSPASPVAFTVTVSARPVVPATDADFRLSSNLVLSFAADATESTGVVRIGLVDDDDPEPDDVVRVSGAVSNTAIPDPDDVTLTIVNDDPEDFDVAVSAPAAVDEDAGMATVTVTLTTRRNSAPVIDVDLYYYWRLETATRGEDYRPPPGEVFVSHVLFDTVPTSAFSPNAAGTAWEAERTFTIGIVDDPEAEGNETIVFRVATSSDSSPNHTIILRDDDTPVLRNVTLVSGPGSDGVWRTGERVDVEVRYSLPVVVERPDCWTLDADGTCRPPGPYMLVGFRSDAHPGYGAGPAPLAPYVGGSGTATLRFAYTVGAAEDGALRVLVGTNGIFLRGATIRPPGGGDVELSEYTNTRVLQVDVVRTGGGAWTAGDTVRVKVTFAGPVQYTPPDSPQNRDEVFVDKRRGTPTIRLRLGEAPNPRLPRTARYERGSGTDTLTFEYAVTAGDGRVSAVEAVADSLARNGATIRNEDGYDAELNHVDVLWYSWLALRVRHATAREGEPLRFTMELARASQAPVTVDYETADGTATAGEDYTAKRGTVTFTPGRTRRTVEVPVLRDGKAEGVETMVLRLSNARSEGSEVPVEMKVSEAQGAIENVAPEVNTPAAGVPTINGTAQVGETLTAGTSGIADQNGLENAAFSYQWLADHAKIAGANSSTRTLTDVDQGKAIRVRVSFTDDAGHWETLTSAPTEPVLEEPVFGDGPPGAPGNLTVTAGDQELTLSWEPPADNGTAPATRYRIEWRMDGKDYKKGHWGTSGSTTYTKTDLANGVKYVFRVKAENGSGNSYGPYGPASEEVSATPTSGSAVDLGTPVLSNTETLHHGMVQLDWEDIEDAGWYVVQYYHVKSGEWLDLPAAGVDIAFHGSGAVVSNLHGLSWLRVRAVSCAGESEWSQIEELYGTKASDWEGVPVPDVAEGDQIEPCPVILGTPVLSNTKTLHHGMVRLDWEDIEDAGWYVVQYYHVKSGEWLDLPAAGVDIAFHGSSAVVSNLHGLSWLRVRAMSCAGESEWSQIEELYGTNASDWEGVPVPEVAEGDEIEPCSEEVATPDNSPATGAPAIGGTAQVGETLTADTSGVADADGLTNATFSYQWLADDSDISGATNATYTLVAEDEGKAIKVQVSFTDDADNEETLTSAATGAVDARPNSPATGAPTINGTAQVGEALTADTSGIADADGLSNVQYEYQWLADDAEIAGATGSTHTLADTDEGKAIKVEVSFTDDAGNDESMTSSATDAVAAPTPNTPATGAPTITGTVQVGETLTADTSGVADADGLTNATFRYQWLADDSDISGATNATYTLADTDEGKAIKVRVSFADDAGNGETLTSAATDAVSAAPTTNTPATGAPAITGTAQVGETLTADTSGIADADGLGNVQYEHQWLADDSEIAGATGSTYTLADTDESKAIKVEVSFTDDAGNDESMTSSATDAVAAPPPNSPATGAPSISGTAQVDEMLTADTSGLADADGLTNATFSYQWLADDTEIAGAASLTYTLVAADEGKVIKVRVTFTDDEGNDESLTSAATDAVAARPNSLATGAPTISGTVQVGKALTADTSGLADVDGLTNATFSYQWLADDTEIAGATSLTYTLAATDEGKAIKVQVTFTDDEGNDESLTSGATDAVAAAEPSEPPAKPRGLEATATHDSVTLTWDDPQDDSITGYVILRRVRENDEGGEFSELVADTGSASTTYTDGTVVAETTYTYRIKAINGAGTSERSRWFHIDIPAAPVPDKPTGLSATATHDQVVLTWDDPGDDSITGYVILRRLRYDDPKGHFDELVADTGTADTTYTDDTVAAGTSYTYRIKAINGAGPGERSRWFHIDTPAAP